jgi:hypothetical protein
MQLRKVTNTERTLKEVSYEIYKGQKSAGSFLYFQSGSFF